MSEITLWSCIYCWFQEGRFLPSWHFSFKAAWLGFYCVFVGFGGSAPIPAELRSAPVYGSFRQNHFSHTHPGSPNDARFLPEDVSVHTHVPVIGLTAGSARAPTGCGAGWGLLSVSSRSLTPLARDFLVRPPCDQRPADRFCVLQQTWGSPRAERNDAAPRGARCAQPARLQTRVKRLVMKPHRMLSLGPRIYRCERLRGTRRHDMHTKKEETQLWLF